MKIFTSIRNNFFFIGVPFKIAAFSFMLFTQSASAGNRIEVPAFESEAEKAITAELGRQTKVKIVATLFKEVVLIDSENNRIDSSKLIAISQPLFSKKINGNQLLRAAYFFNLADNSREIGLVLVDAMTSEPIGLNSTGTLVLQTVNVKANAINVLKTDLETKFPSFAFQVLPILGMINFGPANGKISLKDKVSFLHEILKNKLIDKESSFPGFHMADNMIVNGSIQHSPVVIVDRRQELDTDSLPRLNSK